MFQKQKKICLFFDNNLMQPSLEMSATQVKIQNNKDYEVNEFDPRKREEVVEKKKLSFQKKKSTEINFPERLKKREPVLTKNPLKKNRSEKLRKNFIHKLQMNNTSRKPVEECQQVEKQTMEEQICPEFLNKLESIPAIKLGNISLTLWASANILHSILMVTVFSIIIAFPSIHKSDIVSSLKIFSLVMYLLDIVMNCIIEREEKGRILSNLKDLCGFYMGNLMVIDLIAITIFFIGLLADALILLEFIAILFKLFGSGKRFEKLEYLYINTIQREQYYGLIKVFLTNFAIGHILSVLLNLMAGLAPHSSWWMKIHIVNAEWYVKYVWGYYWGTNIMLTVGFGDLSANNFYEALILIFIQTFSCVTLAYNISYVGALMSSIRQRNEEKMKKLKFLHKMCQENQIPQRLQSEITNYIEESYEIKKMFCYEEQDRVIESLPKNMQLDYRKQAIKTVFDGLGFLNNLSKKSLLKMAQLIQKRIYHPNQLIVKAGCKAEFMILQRGQLCFTCKSNNRRKTNLDGRVINTLSVGTNSKPKIISLNFIKNRELNHDIRSHKYSILYSLTLQHFKESLRSSEMDYQLYCLLRDRDQCFLDEENIYLCQLCKDKYHSKFQCSKLHYRPLNQMVIYHDLRKTKKAKCKRMPFIREKYKHLTMSNINDVFAQHKEFSKQYLGDKQIEKTRLRNTKTIKMRTFKTSSLKAPIFSNLKKILEEQNFLSKFEEIITSNLNQREFWDIEVDKVHNFNFYFKSQNAQSLSDRLLKKSKQSR